MKYKWVARFKKKTICQPSDDRYSKYDPKSEYNPSSFRDFLDYFEGGHSEELGSFELWSDGDCYMVDFTKKGHPEIRMLKKGKNWASDKTIILHREKRELSDIRVIYYRNMETTITTAGERNTKVLGYVIGYQGLDKNGNNRQKKITVI